MGEAGPDTGRGGDRRRRRLSPITLRILAINVLALLILVGGLLYLDEYRNNLIDTELAALEIQAETFAAALGESAVTPAGPAGERLIPGVARQMIRRLSETSDARARLFAADGGLVADTRALGGARGTVQVEPLPPPEEEDGLVAALLAVYDRMVKILPGQERFPPYRESPDQAAGDYPEVAAVLAGEFADSHQVRRRPGGGLVLSVAVPVQHYKHVRAALMMSKGSREIDAALLDVRLNILEVFLVALVVTFLLSVYLARAIARPILVLAAAAEKVRSGLNRQDSLPEFKARSDEIGDLATSLRAMTAALWERMDAIERFAADVAHEIKNPLTSLRSAVETAVRVEDPEQQKKLMAIILDDVQRLDRLISDISEASRLDAELSRSAKEPVDLSRMLSFLVEAQQGRNEAGPALVLEDPGDMVVMGMEDRLVRVFQNLIANAVSFSPPDGTVRVRLQGGAGGVEVRVEDDGPGIPPGKEDAIFDRFYSERPDGEKFGTHSGLGLNIARQIVQAHGGSIQAANRDTGGARFTVRLPAN